MNKQQLVKSEGMTRCLARDKGREEGGRERWHGDIEVRRGG